MTSPQASSSTPAETFSAAFRTRAGGGGAGPEWLVRVAGVLTDGLAPGDEREAARRVHRALERLDGVPLAVVHDWHSRDVCPLLAEAAGHRGASAEPHEAVRSLHTRALAGERIAASVWSAALTPALRDVYRSAYAYQEAYARAGAAASSFALSRGYGEAEAVAYGESYAALNTEANARVHADANARANAAAQAAAFAAADPAAWADTFPYAYVRAGVRAHAGADAARRRAACARLADGLAGGLARVSP
jgi:hypothetical protein